MPDQKVEFYLFRHGETDWNKLGKMQGSTDVPLNQTGLRQAEELRRFFDSFIKDIEFSIDHDLVSSDLSRARDTATIAFRVPESLKWNIRTDVRFRETKLGQGEGLNREELIRNFGEDSWNQWIGLGASSWTARYPGGESKAEVRDRAFAAMQALGQEPDWMKNRNGRRRFAIATHGGLIRRALHALLPNETKPIEVVNGSVFLFHMEKGVFKAQREPVFVP